MTTFRLIKCSGLGTEKLTEVFKQFNNWKEIKERITSRSHIDLLDNLSPRIDSVSLPSIRINTGSVNEISYRTLIFVPGVEESIWINSQNSIVYFPHPGLIILQQPTSVFERLFRLTLHYSLKNRPRSPFENKTIIQVIKAFKNEFKKINGEMIINRTILRNVFFGKENYQELNIKQKEIGLNFLSELSQQAKNWHAFTIRVSYPLEHGEDNYSLRIDRHGNALLYGKHMDDRAKIVADILSSVVRSL